MATQHLTLIPSKVRLTTQGGVVAYEAIGPTANNTVHTFQETHLDLVEQMPASTSNDAGSGVNTTAIASDYISRKNN